MENLTGKQLGPYRIVAPLGEGGMAAVYKAFQPGVERYVALKILPRAFATDPQFVHRFEQEAKVVANLQHPHILPVHDFGETDGYTYIAMPFIETGTLTDLLRPGVPLPFSQIRQVMLQVGDALDYAHSQGVVHRDVKPSNVLVDHRGNCLLTDFGIAKMVAGTAHLTLTGGIIGTPAYMSPEQIIGEQVDGRSDIYSLGIVLYEMATGRPPYRAETPPAVLVKQLHDPLPPPRTFNPGLPEPIERVILKTLAKNPDDRYATAGNFVNAVKAAIPETVVTGDEPTLRDAIQSAGAIMRERETLASSPPVAPTPALPSRVGLKWMLAGAAAIAVVALFGTAVALAWFASGMFLGARVTPTIPVVSTVTLPAATATTAPALTRTTLPTIIPSPLPRSLEDAPIVFERYSHQTPQIFMVNYNGSNLWAVPGQPDYSLVPQVGADGKTLLFRAKTSDGTYQVFSTLLTSGTPTQLTHGNGNNREAALSPDGMLIAFVSDRDDAAGEIYLMNADGSNQRRLTDHPGQDDDPTWSPDGRYLAHESLDPAETKGDIYIYDLETGASTLLTRSAPTRYNLTPDWSPDGKWIAFDGHDKRAEAWAIYIIHQDGSGLRRVVGGDDMCDRPAWSPDSTMLAFATSRETGDREKSNIWRVNLDGRDLIQVTFGDYDFNPSW